MLRHVISVFLVWSLLSCEEVNHIQILEPEPGSFLPKDQPVRLVVKSKQKPLLVNGEKFNSSSFETELPPVDGHGFVKVEKKGDSLFTVLSWLQGHFLDIHEFQPATVQTRLGIDILTHREVSFASLCEDMMAGEELVEYMENPIVVETEVLLVPVTITITTTSVVASAIEVNLHFEGDKLFFHSRLQNVVIYYHSSATGMNSNGKATYEWMEITGELVLEPDNADLVNMTADASVPLIEDDGFLPGWAFDLLLPRLDEAVRDAIMVTTRNSSREVFHTLMTRLVPQVVLDFEHPIDQATEVQTLGVVEQNVAVEYRTKIHAVTPLVAKAGQGVLERFHRDQRTETGMSISFGSPLVNQIAYAMWDAGNAAGIVYTKQQLYDLGMERLGGYYERLKSSEINLLLPPILEWDETGPWLEMGGIHVTMKLDGDKDTHATTAGKVPIFFEQEGNAIILKRDNTREVIFFDVGFNRMSEMVDAKKVVKLLRTAVPGVVSDLFSTFPIVRMTSTSLEKLNGDPGPVVLTILNGITAHAGFWRMDLDFVRLDQ